LLQLLDDLVNCEALWLLSLATPRMNGRALTSHIRQSRGHLSTTGSRQCAWQKLNGWHVRQARQMVPHWSICVFCAHLPRNLR
jgi:hypothetical protein